MHDWSPEPCMAVRCNFRFPHLSHNYRNLPTNCGVCNFINFLFFFFATKEKVKVKKVKVVGL